MDLRNQFGLNITCVQSLFMNVVISLVLVFVGACCVFVFLFVSRGGVSKQCFRTCPKIRLSKTTVQMQIIRIVSTLHCT